MNRYPRLTALARTFPMFQPGRGWHEKVEAAGIEPFDAAVLWEQAKPWSHGERCVVQFLCSVYCHDDYPFNLHEALGVWDDRNRAAFVAWAQDPWWA